MLGFHGISVAPISALLRPTTADTESPGTSGGGRRYRSPGWKDVLDLRDTPNDDDEVIMAVIKEFLRIAT